MKRISHLATLIAFFLISLHFKTQTGNYLDFDGANDEIFVQDASQYIAGASGISMTGWFCIDNLSYGQGFYSFRDNSFGGQTANSSMYAVLVGGQQLECRYIANGTLYEYLAPNGVIQVGQWQHVALIYDGSSFNLYINGILSGSVAANGSFLDTNRPFSIGRTIISSCCGTEFFFDGKIDEVSLWSKALTQIEIQDMMADELVGDEINLELYYKMNQGVPGGNNTGISELISEVGAPVRNGDIVNFALNGPGSNFGQLDDASFTLTNFCPNAPNEATLIATPGGTFTFDIDPSDGATIDGTSGEIFNGIAGTAYDVLYTTTGPCENSHTESVTVATIPTINNVTHTCSVDELTYTVSFNIIGGNPMSYVIVGNPGAITGNLFTSDPILSGSNYNISISDGDNCGLANVADSFLCTCLASASFNGDISFCNGTSTVIPIDVTVNAPWTISYTFNGVPQDDFISASNPILLPIEDQGIYLFTGITDINCFSALNEIIIATALNLPTAVISGEIEICVGEPASLNIDLTGVGPWEVIIGIDGIPQAPIMIFSPNYTLPVIQDGIYSILNVQDANCSNLGTGFGELVINDLPSASINGDILICENTAASLFINLTGTPDFNLTYSIDGITQDVLTINQSNQYEFPLTETGVYELLSIEDLFCNGSVSGSSIITSAPPPSAFINGDFTICEGTEQAIEVVLSGSPSWIIDYAINGISQTPLNATTSPFLIPATIEGEYIITEVSDIYCTNTGDGIANINFYPDISLTNVSSDEICSGENVGISVTTTGGLGDNYNYTWSQIDLLFQSDSTAIYNPSYTSNVQVTVTDDCNISEAFDLTLVVNQLPAIAISSEKILCGPQLVELTNLTPENFAGNSCRWIINGDTLYECNVLEYYFGTEGSYDVNLKIESPEGCINEVNFEDHITILAESIADFSYSPQDITTLNPIVQFENESSDGATFTQWEFGDLESTNQENPIFDFPINTGQLNWKTCLYVDNEYGCSDSLCQVISIKGDIILFIPNSFTPDGDGLNEFFYPVLLGASSDNYIFRIFNQYGNILFESEDITEKWNGSLKNPDFYAPDGVYNWQIIANITGTPEKREFFGSVNMIR